VKSLVVGTLLLMAFSGLFGGLLGYAYGVSKPCPQCGYRYRYLPPLAYYPVYPPLERPRIVWR
jgi:hypothetical protein